MKKFMLALGLILMLVCWGWPGDNGVGTAPAIGTATAAAGVIAIPIITIVPTTIITRRPIPTRRRSSSIIPSPR